MSPTPIFDRFTSPTVVLMAFVCTLVGKNPGQGVQTQLHAVLSPEMESGQFYSDCRKATLLHPRLRWDAGGETAREFFEKTTRLLKLDK